MTGLFYVWNENATFFVRALKAIAPILVFALGISSIANAGKGNGQQFRMVTVMYILSTLLAAVVAVSASFIFPVNMTLDLESYQADVVPSGIMEVLQNLLLNITDNPIHSMFEANYLCILACSLFGIPQDISMQAVAVGMIIGVVQDSLETAINSSGDVLFAATAEYRQWQKEGRDFKIGAILDPDE